MDSFMDRIRSSALVDCIPRRQALGTPDGATAAHLSDKSSTRPSPHHVRAASSSQAITLSTVKAICSQYKASAGTAHRVIDELKANGLATASREGGERR
jgi:hypothetical protein